MKKCSLALTCAALLSMTIIWIGEHTSSITEFVVICILILSGLTLFGLLSRVEEREKILKQKDEGE
jgi:archaellum biogenesis protein FlaJ (TadC family)